MSDTFNLGTNKTKILQHFRLNEEQDVETAVFPKQFALPDEYVKEKSAQQMSDILIAEKLDILKPAEIRGLVETEVLFISPNWRPKTHGNKYLLPLSKKSFLPKYRAAYFQANYDVAALKQLLYQSVVNEQFTEVERVMLLKVFDSARDTVFTNGTFEGQMHRMKKMADIAYRKDMPESANRALLTICLDEFNTGNKGKTPYSDANPYEIIAKIMDKYLPINGTGKYLDGGFKGLYYAPSWYVSLIPGKQYDYLPPIGLDKSAGFPYIGKQKKDVIVESIAISDMIVNATARALSLGVSSTTGNIDLNSNTGTNAVAKLREIYNDFWWLGAGTAFPKAERYKRSEVMTKTRNIYTMPFTAHMLASIIYAPPMAGSPNFSTYDTPSLYKFTPFHGGMDDFINDMLSRMEQRDPLISYVYADNWYLILLNEEGHYDYYSIDFEKAESQHMREDVRAVAYYLLTRGHQIDGRPAFNLTWAQIALNLIPTISVDNTVVAGNAQILWPGLSSGVTWTYITNHARTSVWDAIYRNAYEPAYRHKIANTLQPSDDPNSQFQKFACQRGFRMKVERLIKNIDVELTELTRGHDPENLPTDSLKVVELDLLGWGVTYHPKLEQYLPILESDRLAGSFANPKFDDKDKKYKEKPWLIQTYKFARATALQMVGAWNYPFMMRTCKRFVHDSREKLRRTTKYGDIGTMPISGTEFADFLDIADVTMDYNFGPEQFNDLHARKERPAEYQPYVPVEAGLLTEATKQLSALAYARMDQYLQLKGLKLDDKTYGEFIKEPLFKDALNEFNSFRAIFSKGSDVMNRQEKWKNVNSQELANPYSSLLKAAYTEHEYGSMPSGKVGKPGEVNAAPVVLPNLMDLKPKLSLLTGEKHVGQLTEIKPKIVSRSNGMKDVGYYNTMIENGKEDDAISAIIQDANATSGLTWKQYKDVAQIKFLFKGDNFNRVEKAINKLKPG